MTPCSAGRIFRAVDGLEDYWYEISDSGGAPEQIAKQVGPIVSSLLNRENETLRMAKALASRFEEVELIYTITETLGSTIQLQEAAQKIVEAVSEVVGSRRASILVFDQQTDSLKPVACVGRDVTVYEPIPVSHECSIAARAAKSADTAVKRFSQCPYSTRGHRTNSVRLVSSISPIAPARTCSVYKRLGSYRRSQVRSAWRSRTHVS